MLNFERFRSKDKIDYDLPTFTLDVNTVSVKDRSGWNENQKGLTLLEYNYFNHQNLELCVTPEAMIEIVSGQPLDSLGTITYQRFQKSALFKSRPAGTILTLKDDEPNILWSEIREILFSTVTDELLNDNQKADITHMFYHCTASGSLENSAFLTNDNNFHRNASALDDRFGIRVMYPTQAWEYYRNPYDLREPTDSQVRTFMYQHDDFLAKVKSESSMG